MKLHKMELLGICETKKKGEGEQRLKDNFTLRYSGRKEGRAKQGVGFITSEEMEKRVVEWKPVNSRIITITLELDKKTKIIQI